MKPRIRTIKPEAHIDEHLWDAEQETGLPLFRAFTGLWCHADREGRFEWRPRPLKAGILPYWEGDFSRVLDALATRGFVVKYVSGGREYGYIRTFKDHQFINNREPASSLPDPEEAESFEEDPRVTDASTTGESRVPDAPIRSRSRSRSVPDPDPVPRGGAGGGPETELEDPPIPCPADLKLTEAQATNREMAGCPRWAQEQLTRSFVGRYLADAKDRRPLTAWLKCLDVAIGATWSDPSKRPKRQDDADPEATRKAKLEAEAEERRKRLLEESRRSA